MLFDIRKTSIILIAYLLFSLCLPLGHAFEADSGSKNLAEGLSFAVGLEYSSGDYGTAYTTDTRSIPLELSYSKNNFFSGANTSYINAKSTGTVIVSTSGGGGRKRTVTTSSSTTSNSVSGLGDLNLYAGYKFPIGKATHYSVTAALKLPTADENKGLGTGEVDYSIEGGLLHKLEDTRRLFASIGYQITGDSPTTNYDNIFYANAGIAIDLPQKRTVGAMLDYVQAASAGFDDALEVTGFMNLQLADKRSLYIYALLGLSNGSPDYGAGVSYQYSY